MLSRFVAALLLTLTGLHGVVFASTPVQQRDIEILVVDVDGKPIEEYGWLVVVQSPSSQTSLPEAIQPRPAGRATVHVPEGQATIEIRSDRHKTPGRVTIPEQAPSAPLRITLLAQRALLGRVLFEGSPVAGATVELVQREPNRFEGLLNGYWSGMYIPASRITAKTDGTGNFRYVWEYPPAEFYVHAWAPGFADAFSEPQHGYDAPVDVSLEVGGAIEGKLVLPAGRSADGLAVEVFRKRLDAVTSTLGVSFKTKADATGKWTIDSLGAGPWMVRVSIVNPAAVGLDAQVAKRCFDVPWVVEVPTAATVPLSLDLAAEKFCTLEGQFKIDALVNSGYAELFTEPPYALNPTVALLDTSGRFTLRSRSEGHFRIGVHPGLSSRSDRFATDVVELVFGANSWSKEIKADAWTGRGVRFDQH